MSTEVPEILLSHYLKTLKLPTFQRRNGPPEPNRAQPSRDDRGLAVTSPRAPSRAASSFTGPI